MQYKDGSIYKGEFKDDLRYGEGTLTEILNGKQVVKKGKFIKNEF